MQAFNGALFWRPLFGAQVFLGLGKVIRFVKSRMALLDTESDFKIIWTRPRLHASSPFAGVFDDFLPFVGISKIMSAVGRAFSTYEELLEAVFGCWRGRRDPRDVVVSLVIV